MPNEVALVLGGVITEGALVQVVDLQDKFLNLLTLDQNWNKNKPVKTENKPVKTNLEQEQTS